MRTDNKKASTLKVGFSYPDILAGMATAQLALLSEEAHQRDVRHQIVQTMEKSYDQVDLLILRLERLEEKYHKALAQLARRPKVE